jgi:hypothetical protein
MEVLQGVTGHDRFYTAYNACRSRQKVRKEQRCACQQPLPSQLPRPVLPVLTDSSIDLYSFKTFNQLPNPFCGLLTTA